MEQIDGAAASASTPVRTLEQLLAHARRWLYEHRLLIVHDRALRALVAAASRELEAETAAMSEEARSARPQLAAIGCSTERAVIERRRGPAMKLGLALHLGFVRMSGRPLDAFRVLPVVLLRHLGKSEPPAGELR